jgi:uncharacterized membrane protein YebE (DUF533 family)
MNNFINTTNLGLNHIQTIVKGMYAVAKSDDVHQTELVQIMNFYESCRQESDGLADFKDLISTPFSVEAAKEALDTPELKEVFFKSLYFLAFADGQYTAKEKTTISSIAKHLGVADSKLQQIEEQVRDQLLMQISRIHNLEALTQIAKRMK